jgi:hypothetical protein
MILHGPIALMQATRSDDPLLRLIAAGEKLSNLAWQMGVNGNGDTITRQNWADAYKEWDQCAREFAKSLNAVPLKEERT